MPSAQSKISKYVWLYIALIVAMMAVVKVSTVETAMKAEHRLVTSALGQTSSDYVYSHAADWYRTIAVDWEMHRMLENMFIPTDEERARSKGLEEFGNYLFKYMHERLEAFWRGLYMLFTRMWVLFLWLPFIPIVVFPAINHGWQIRNIKRTNFDYASPTKHIYAVATIKALLVILLTLIVAPVPMTPLIYPAILMICGILAAVSVANIQKRL